MSHKPKSAKFYAAAVKAMRPYVSGFEAADGFNLSHADKWTPAQKGLITKYFNEFRELTARNHYVFRGRNPENMAKAKAYANQAPEMKRFKVAFVPFEAAKGKQGTRPEIRFTKDKMVIDAPGRLREFVAFDKRLLATDIEAEIARLRPLTKGAGLFALQCGAFMRFGVVANTDLDFAMEDVVKLMNQYDGIKPLTGSKAGDHPMQHQWRRWLDGLVVYKFHRGGKWQQVITDYNMSKELNRVARGIKKKK